MQRTFVVSMVLIVAYSVGPEDWSGALLAAGRLFVAAVLLWRASRAASWSLGHMVAIATAALLTRSGLAFFYFPVVGGVGRPQVRSQHRAARHRVRRLLRCLACESDLFGH